MTTLFTRGDAVGAATLEIISGADSFNRWMYEEIKPYLHGLVLELGSGTGNISRFVLEDKFETVLSDYNSAYVDCLQKKFSGNPCFKAVVSINLQDPHFEKENQQLHEKFDSIFLLNVIEHLQHDGTAVVNCRYLLKPGGTLIVLAPAYHFLYCDLDKNLGHFRRYTTNSLANLLGQNQFTITRKKYFNLAGIAGWFVWGKLLRTQQLQAGSMKLFNILVPLIRLADRLTARSIGLSAIVTGKKNNRC